MGNIIVGQISPINSKNSGQTNSPILASQNKNSIGVNQTSQVSNGGGLMDRSVFNLHPGISILFSSKNKCRSCLSEFAAQYLNFKKNFANYDQEYKNLIDGQGSTKFSNDFNAFISTYLARDLAFNNSKKDNAAKIDLTIINSFPAKLVEFFCLQNKNLEDFLSNLAVNHARKNIIDIVNQEDNVINQAKSTHYLLRELSENLMNNTRDEKMSKLLEGRCRVHLDEGVLIKNPQKRIAYFLNLCELDKDLFVKLDSLSRDRRNFDPKKADLAIKELIDNFSDKYVSTIEGFSKEDAREVLEILRYVRIRNF